jgi:bifunctional DNase/RNase
MIEMTVDRIATDPNNKQRIVWLRTLQGHRLVPIVIGEGEAFSIALSLIQQDAPRPLAHDLMHTILGRLEGSVDKVEIVSMKEGTFFAELTLTGPDGQVSIDARPSDCLALALRAGAPIYVAENLLDSEGVLAEGEVGDALEEAVAVPEVHRMSPDQVDNAIQELISSAGLETRQEETSEDVDVMLRKLRWRLELAVTGEDYERAARLRDRIDELEANDRTPVKEA